MLDEALRIDRARSRCAGRRRRRATSGPTRSATAAPRARCAPAATCASSRSGKMVEAAEEAAGAARRAGRARHGVGRPHGPARPADARRRAPPRPRGHRRGRHRRRRRRRRDRRPRSPGWRRDAPAAGRVTLGTPLAYLPHGKPATSSPTSVSTAPASPPPSLKALDAALTPVTPASTHVQRRRDLRDDGSVTSRGLSGRSLE